MTQAIGDAGRKGRRDAQAEEPARERALRRAEASITIELA
jgi:hypothetical protein